MNQAVFVDYEEPLYIKVGKLLLQKYKDISLSDCVGCAEHFYYEKNSVGIVWRNPQVVPVPRFFGLFSSLPRRQFIGTVWFNNESLGADESNWVFEVHGRDIVAFAKQIASDLSSAFGVKITIRLVTEQPLEEVYFSDYDC